ncbi:MAG TPA: hypothetical protein VN578_11405 [Candidatus Binatia bacterium]|nr:hypothetical protein [Candidatus Binatia bacterium]
MAAIFFKKITLGVFAAGIPLTPALSMNRNGHKKAQKGTRISMAKETNPEGPRFLLSLVT